MRPPIAHLVEGARQKSGVSTVVVVLVSLKCALTLERLKSGVSRALCRCRVRLKNPIASHPSALALFKCGTKAKRKPHFALATTIHKNQTVRILRIFFPTWSHVLAINLKLRGGLGTVLVIAFLARSSFLALIPAIVGWNRRWAGLEASISASNSPKNSIVFKNASRFGLFYTPDKKTSHVNFSSSPATALRGAEILKAPNQSWNREGCRKPFRSQFNILLRFYA